MILILASALFVEAFPFLERLDICDPNSFLYAVLITAHTFGQWKYLKIINPPLSDNQIRVYVDCALKYGDSLTCLLLCDSLYTRLSVNRNGLQLPQYERLASRLDHFPQLERLKIIKHSNDNNLVSHFSHFLADCPKLDSFCFKIFSLGEKDTLTISRNPQSIMRTISVKSSIRYLKGIGYLNCESSLLYIMCKFPGMKELKLDNMVLADTMTTASPLVSASVAARFLLYVARIPSHRAVTFYVAKDTILDIMLTY
jgi:hypothetical protein